MIELKHVSKYYGTFKALDDINLKIDDGCIYGIVGQSGAGKSTLIRCINMLEAPSSGDVFIDGKNMTKLSPKELRKERRNIGMIFQHFNLLSNRTVAKNVAFPLELAGVSKSEQKEKIDNILKLVGLEAYKDKYPAQLSGGQKQRVGIARALVTNPSVLLSDEATSALDPETVKSILHLLDDINKKLHITIILITHQMEVIKQICQKVAVIEHGKIIEEGSTVDLFTAPKTQTLKNFVSTVMSSEVPEQLSHMNIQKERTSPSDQTVINLSFRGDVANEPIIANLIRRYNLNVSILYGSIDYIQNVAFGNLGILLSGSNESVAKANQYLNSLPITSEVIGYVPSNDESSL